MANPLSGFLGDGMVRFYTQMGRGTQIALTAQDQDGSAVEGAVLSRDDESGGRHPWRGVPLVCQSGHSTENGKWRSRVLFSASLRTDVHPHVAVGPTALVLRTAVRCTEAVGLRTE